MNAIASRDKAARYQDDWVKEASQLPDEPYRSTRPRAAVSVQPKALTLKIDAQQKQVRADRRIKYGHLLDRMDADSYATLVNEAFNGIVRLVAMRSAHPVGLIRDVLLKHIERRIIEANGRAINPNSTEA